MSFQVKPYHKWSGDVPFIPKAYLNLNTLSTISNASSLMSSHPGKKFILTTGGLSHQYHQN